MVNEVISLCYSVLCIEKFNCRVLSVEPLSKRIEVTLKTSDSRTASQSEINNLSNLHVGDIVIGQIKRVESYGLFITIENTNLVRNK